MTTQRDRFAVLAWLESLNAFATRIEHDLQRGVYKHCAVYEHELKELWPPDDEQREAKITKFAKEYGFRLLFYQKGLCAIFDKEATRN